MRRATNRGFLLVSVMLILMVLFILMFSLMTLSEQRSRLVKTNADRTVLSAEARAGIAEAAHYLDGLSDWTTASSGIPSAEASLNNGAWHRIEVLSATATEVRVRSTAYLKDHRGDPALNRKLDATFRRAGVNFPDAAIFGANGAHLDSNARTDSYDSTQGSYADTQGNNGHIGSNATGGSPVTLDPNSHVNGDLVIQDGTNPDVAGNATYNQIDYKNEPVPLPLATPPASLSGASSQGNVTLEDGQTLGPGHYGDLTIDGNVTLEAGTYLFDNFEMLSNSRLTVTGQTIIYFRDTVNIRSNTFLNTNGAVEDSSLLQFYGDSTSDVEPSVTLNSNTNFVGIIYNPTGPVVVESHAEIWGGLVGETVRLKSNAVAHFDRVALGVQLAETPDAPPEIRSWESW